MPSKSPAQKRTMAAIAHGWRPKKDGLARIPVKVAKEYNEADQDMHMGDEKKKKKMMAKMLMKC